MNGQMNRTLTIFGGTGDLSYRKLMPAFYNLYSYGKLSDKDQILAIGRRDYSQEEYIEIIQRWVSSFSRIEYNEELFQRFAQRILYFKMDFTNLNEYSNLTNYFCGCSMREHLFYYAVAPRFFPIISDGIFSIGCRGNSKLIIEKPFGETLEEANILSQKLESCFGKENIYRIDHYLGKEMVQSIQTIRFANPIFQNCWDAQSIERVEIYANEEVGVETRAGYYDKAGALKDMVQNHLMQILSLVAMEPPISPAKIKEKQADVFRNLRAIEQLNLKQTLILGQYRGYLEEPGVSLDSKTETYASCKLYIDTPRWKDVPFFISTGKKLKTREMKVIITFRKTQPDLNANVLTFKIQPTEGVNLQFNIKEPGDSNAVIPADMDFCQSCNIVYRMNTPEAYERLIGAALESDATWFSSWDQIYLSWNYIESLKQLYHSSNLPLFIYEQNSDNVQKLT